MSRDTMHSSSRTIGLFCVFVFSRSLGPSQISFKGGLPRRSFNAPVDAKPPRPVEPSLSAEPEPRPRMERNESSASRTHSITSWRKPLWTGLRLDRKTIKVRQLLYADSENKTWKNVKSIKSDGLRASSRTSHVKRKQKVVEMPIKLEKRQDRRNVFHHTHCCLSKDLQALRKSTFACVDVAKDRLTERKAHPHPQRLHVRGSGFNWKKLLYQMSHLHELMFS